MSRTNKWMIGTFAVLMIAHWLEHIFQAYQVYAMHMPRACALGMLGMKYPWLIKTEALHFGFAIFTTVGLLMLWHVYVTGKVASDQIFIMPRTAPSWIAATYISIWHLFEHTLLFAQAMTHPWFGKAVPTSLIQLLIPRIELHLFYNSMVTVPIIMSMYMMTRLLKIKPISVTNLVFTMPSDGKPASATMERDGVITNLPVRRV